MRSSSSTTDANGSAPGAPSSSIDVRARMRSALAFEAIRLPAAVDEDDAFVQRGDDRAVALLAVAQPLLDPLALHELADLAAQRAQHRQVIVVGLAGLGAEERHHADHLGAVAQRNRERRVQPRVLRQHRQRQHRLLGEVRDPERQVALPHPPGEPDVGRDRAARAAAPGIRRRGSRRRARCPRSAGTAGPRRPPTARRRATPGSRP